MNKFSNKNHKFSVYLKNNNFEHYFVSRFTLLPFLYDAYSFSWEEIPVNHALEQKIFYATVEE